MQGWLPRPHPPVGQEVIMAFMDSNRWNPGVRPHQSHQHSQFTTGCFKNATTTWAAAAAAAALTLVS